MMPQTHTVIVFGSNQSVLADRFRQGLASDVRCWQSQDLCLGTNF